MRATEYAAAAAESFRFAALRSAAAFESPAIESRRAVLLSSVLGTAPAEVLMPPRRNQSGWCPRASGRAASHIPTAANATARTIPPIAGAGRGRWLRQLGPSADAGLNGPRCHQRTGGASLAAGVSPGASASLATRVPLSG